MPNSIRHRPAESAVRKQSAPVVVIGASLAGLATAARLAKAGHQVTLLEATDRLGGGWATVDAGRGVAADTAAPVFAFPAPWRDLFRKSGRTLEAEFARQGLELTPAPPARHRFPDGSELELPSGRGDQHAAIGKHFGPGAATAWGKLIDARADDWQLLRRLGVESELSGKHQLSQTVRTALRHKHSLTDLANTLPDPRLAAIVADLGYLHGSRPEHTPAFVAVQAYLEQAFGRWSAGSASTLIGVLAGRLKLRRVQVRTGTPARGVRMSDGRVSGVVIDGQELPADAVISTCDPYQLYDQLLDDRRNAERRRLHRLCPAWAPAIARSWIDTPPEISQTITHRERGGPLIEYTQPWTGSEGATRTLLITHDYGRPEPDPAAGVRWNGFRSWLNRPPVTSRISGLFTAGPFSRGGALPSMQLQSGALASYGAQLLLGSL